MERDKLGDRLFALRTKRGLTQEEVAKKVGVSNKTFSKWETGATVPDIYTLVLLAETFGVTTDNLLGISDDQTNLFDKMVNEAFKNNLYNPASVLFRMLRSILGASQSYFLDGSTQDERWVPVYDGAKGSRCVVSGRSAYQLTVNSNAVNFAMTLFLNKDDFGWLKEEDKLLGIADLFCFLGDPDTLKLCREVHNERFPCYFTVAFAAEKCGIQEDKVIHILEQMEKYRFCSSEMAHLGDGDVRIYRSEGEGCILAVIVLAYEQQFGERTYELAMNPSVCKLIGGDET